MAIFICPECGCNDSVCVRTISNTGETIRRRRCIKCAHIIETTETVTDKAPKTNKRGRPPKNPNLQDAVKEAMKTAK